MIRPLLIAAVLVIGPAVGATPALARYAAIVVDADTGRVLHEHDADVRKYPASLTKMMTLYLAFEALETGRLKMTSQLSTSEHAAGQAPSKLGLAPGERISVKDAILALITKSANDASVVLAEGMARNEFEFARLMTAKARALGMAQTNFQNANGLPHPRQMSTARDMATLARALQRDFPNHYPLFATESFTFKGTTHRNHNHLLGAYEGADGIKTGFIRASGFNLVASAKRDGRRLIGVVFGGDSGRSRDAKMVGLLDDGFERVRRQPLLIAKADKPRQAPASFALIKPAMAGEPEIGSADDEPTVVVSGRAQVAALPPAERTASPRRSEDREARAAPRGTPDRSDAKVGGWGIQVGAYAAEDAARAAALSAKRDPRAGLTKATPEVLSLKQGRTTLYRARLTGISQADAKRACGELAKNKTPCMVVPPKG